MERYREYRPTSIQWLKNIPSHWEERKISSIFRERREKVSDKDYAPLSVSKQGVTPQLENAVKSDNGDNRKLVLAGDFVVNSRSDRKGSCGVSQIDGSVSLINIVLEPCTDINKMYFHYLARSNNYIEEYYRLGRGIVADLWTTRYSELKGMMIPFPTLKEQDRIVNYINCNTSKIDSYVADKEKEIDLLQELKQKTIADAVTKGLNPDVTKKDSGISWLGMIPENWETKRIASLFTGKIKANSNFEYHHAFKFYYGTLVPKEETGDIEEYRDTYVKYSVLQKDDIMINGLNLNYDFVSQRVAIAPSDGIITSAYVVVRPRIGTNAQYYNYLFKTMDNMKLFHGMGTGIRLTLSFDELKKQLVVVPPQDEQESIVTYIEEKCQKIDTLINDLQTEIESLKEYKQRLIADVVTGQIKV